MRRFAHFWYDFVIGDDWRIALGVVTGLALTAFVARQGWPAWWLLPLLVVCVLASSIAVEVRAGTQDLQSEPEHHH